MFRFLVRSIIRRLLGNTCAFARPIQQDHTILAYGFALRFAQKIPPEIVQEILSNCINNAVAYVDGGMQLTDPRVSNSISGDNKWSACAVHLTVTEGNVIEEDVEPIKLDLSSVRGHGQEEEL